MTRFIVVRHGYSVANHNSAFAGLVDVPLTELGKRQAEYVADYLAAYEKVDKIFYSGLTRTRQTAEPSAKRLGLPLHTEKGLTEVFAGLWENETYRTINKRYHEDWMRWLYDYSNGRCTLGESMREHYVRVADTVRRLAAAHEGQTLLLFTHFNPLRVMNAMAEGLPPEQLHRAPAPANASVNIYSYENGALRAEKQNVITYPPSLSARPLMPKP